MRITSGTAFAASVALGALALTGCTTTVSPRPTISSSASETTADPSSSTEALYGADALPLSEYVRAYPQYTPAELRAVDFLLEESSSRTQEFPLPAHEKSIESLVLAIFCDDDSPYEIAVMRDTDVVDRTWGAQCPRSGIVVYTTAPLTSSTEGLTIRATVDDGTPYRLAVGTHR